MIIGEMLTTSFFMLFISIGFFAAALATSIGLSYYSQGFICAAISVLGVVVLRKPIQKHLVKGKPSS
ncbi:MAG: hypothetical protein A2Z20_05340 [Bdellovibrionales bacterium RBG_16_40_8]|nr:MAG: hypothetical protein A2Z20_05340 [Bdellovibrionales bacterium RBG_16_40_8]